MDLGDGIEIEELGDLGGVDAVVFLFGFEDQTHLSGMADEDLFGVGVGGDLLVEVTVAAGSLEAEVERFGDFAQGLEHAVPAADDLLGLDLAALVIQDADAGFFPVDIQTDVQHCKPPFGLDLVL